LTTPLVITVFGSSRPRPGEEEYERALEVGAALAHEGFRVCTGGYGGIMEAAARGAKGAGGSTIGVTTRAFPGKKANRWVDEVIVADSLITRLEKLMTLGAAYVVLKGGTGTLLELAAVWEFMNKELMREKPILLVGPFWAGVVATLRDELAWEGGNDPTRSVTLTDAPADSGRILREKLSLF
jgi:uncharacterized protein (TIGR00730 family)